MALAVTNFGSDIPAPINNVYMRGLLSAARKTLPFFNGTLPGVLEKAGGSMTVKWRRIQNLAAATTALSELSPGATVAFGIGRTAVNPTIHNVTKAVAKYGNAIITTEEVDLFNINSNTMALIETLGANAGESLNLVAQAEFDNSTQLRYASAVANKSAVVADITLNDIKYCVNLLNRNSAMKMFSMATGSQNVTTSTVRSSYFGINHPDVEEDVRALSGFVGVEQYGGYTETLVGEYGAVGGVRFVSTEIAPVGSASGASNSTSHRATADGDVVDVYTTYIYGREAVGTIGLGVRYGTNIKMMYEANEPPVEIISHPPGSSGVGDMFNEVGSIAWKAWHATKILNGTWLVKALTAASKLN